MFNNIMLDVFTGLVFVYLLYSLLGSILQEMIARWFSLRSRMLQMGIRRMLEDDNKPSSITFINAIVEIWYSIVRFFWPTFFSKSDFTSDFFKYPSIKYLAGSSWKSKPSYLECNNFSNTILSMLRRDSFDGSIPQMNLIRDALFSRGQYQDTVGNLKSIDPETLANLKKIYTESANDIDRFRTLLEKWFNDTMDRTTGWYTRQNRSMLFFIGCFLAYNFNIDSIAICKLLSRDRTAKDNMVQLAISSRPKYDNLVSEVNSINAASKPEIKEDSGAGTKTITKTFYVPLPDAELLESQKIVQSDIDKAENIAGLGWPDTDSCERCNELNEKRKSLTDSVEIAKINTEINYYYSTYKCAGNPYQNKKTRIVGWLLTAFAITLGASFWFDMLNKLITLRSSRKPKQQDEGSADNSKNTSGFSPINRVG